MNVDSSLAARLYDSVRKISPERPEMPEAARSAPAMTDQPESFADAVTDAGRSLVETLRRGEASMKNVMTGQGDVQSVVEALTATELALETAVTVRNRVVEAYQELLRMPI